MHGIDDRLARRNVFVLAAAQALAGGNSTVMLSTAAITGAMLAPTPLLATMPATTYVIGQWLGTLPVGMLAQRFGRRTAFQIGAGFGLLSGLIACIAVIVASFYIFMLGSFCAGVYAAAHQSYRFAAADTASEAFRPKAISWVLGGGVAAAFFGPQLVILTKDMWQPYLFAASYLAQAAVAVVAIAVLYFVRIPLQPRGRLVGEGAGRPLAEIVRQPRFIVAVLCGILSYSLMNLVMTSAPLAMLACNFSITEATLGLQWHVLGMFAPSFFTGSLCVRFGADKVTGAGLALFAIGAAIGVSGITLFHFWAVLLLLGVGWNFGFIGATTMVAMTHRPEERIRVQSFNDFLIFGSLAVSSLSSGPVLAIFGWATLNALLFPLVLLAGTLLVWQARRRSRQAA